MRNGERIIQVQFGHLMISFRDPKSYVYMNILKDKLSFASISVVSIK